MATDVPHFTFDAPDRRYDKGQDDNPRQGAMPVIVRRGRAVCRCETEYYAICSQSAPCLSYCCVDYLPRAPAPLSPPTTDSTRFLAGLLVSL